MLTAPRLLCQDCTIIISEHVTTENSNDKLIEHIGWIKQNLSNYSAVPIAQIIVLRNVILKTHQI